MLKVDVTRMWYLQCQVYGPEGNKATWLITLVKGLSCNSVSMDTDDSRWIPSNTLHYGDLCVVSFHFQTVSSLRAGAVSSLPSVSSPSILQTVGIQ